MSASISRSKSSTQTPLADASDARHGRDLRWRLHRRVSAALALAQTRPQMRRRPQPQLPESDQRLWLRAVGLAVVLSLALIGGCSKPQLDTSTAEQFETSVEGVRAKLPMDARAEFDAALLSLTGALPERRADADPRPADLGQRPAFEALSPSLRAQLQGRTGRQVIAIATKVREEREAHELKAAALERERRRRSALNELRGLRGKLDAYNLEILQGLSVIKARLITNEVENELDLVKDWFAINAEDSDGRQATNRPLTEIELEIASQVRNGIYGVLFEIELFKLDETQPWRRIQTKQRFPRGLFFAQTATRRVTPEAFHDLFARAAGDRPPHPDELILVVRPVQLYGADGEAFAGAEISDAELARVQQLIDELSQPESTVALASADNEGAPIRASAGGDPAGQAASPRQAADLALAAQVEAIRSWQRGRIARAYRAEAEAIRAERRAAEARHAPLRQFLVEQARFHWSESAIHRKPVIELQVRNGTPETITGCRCRGRLSSAERERPWVDAGLEHRFKGGLAPGETRELRLVPNWLGPWGAAPKDRDDLVLSVEPKRLDGKVQKDLFAYDFPAPREQQLARLEALIAERGW